MRQEDANAIAKATTIRRGALHNHPSLDVIAKCATVIAEDAGLWQKVAGLCGALYLSPSPSLFFTSRSHALTRFVKCIRFQRKFVAVTATSLRWEQLQPLKL